MRYIIYTILFRSASPSYTSLSHLFSISSFFFPPTFIFLYFFIFPLFLFNSFLFLRPSFVSVLLVGCSSLLRETRGSGGYFYPPDQIDLAFHPGERHHNSLAADDNKCSENRCLSGMGWLI